MKLHLNSNVVEGTPEELVEYLKLVKEEDLNKSLYTHTDLLTEQEQDTFKGLTDSIETDYSYSGSPEGSTDEAETASTDIEVGDRVKVLRSNYGAEGVATVTKILEDGEVELAGKNKYGKYSPNWSNHVSNLEKIEEEAPMGYTYWYLFDIEYDKFVVLKATMDENFEDSLGGKYILKEVSGLIKPIDREDVREEYEGAEYNGKLLKYYPTVDMFVREY
ncbi:hypothetical protein PALS1_088 [Staphylococcus phage PALS_1]|nr:hypothetical protein PALS1_088 [Staphylococcus phage PALS_1]